MSEQLRDVIVSTAVYDHVIVNRLQMAGMDMVLRKFANLTDHLQLYVSVTSLYIYIYFFFCMYVIFFHFMHEKQSGLSPLQFQCGISDFHLGAQKI